MVFSSFSPQELVKHATLTKKDMFQINQCRFDHNRLGFAYQLSFIRLVNRFPGQQPLEIISELLSLVGNHLNIDPSLISEYDKRQATVSEHQFKIRGYLKKNDLGEHEASP